MEMYKKKKEEVRLTRWLNNLLDNLPVTFDDCEIRKQVLGPEKPVFQLDFI
jgi:hypothetical protein